jgi:hypothetical protein
MTPENYLKLDDLSEFFKTIGNFWTDFFQDKKLLTSYGQALFDFEKQNQINFEELLASLSRYKIRPYHTELVKKVLLKKSEIENQNTAIPQFGEGYQFRLIPEIQYGVPVLKNWLKWKVPNHLVSVPLIFNQIKNTSYILVNGLDYVLKDGYLYLRENPFDGRFEQIYDYNGNEIVETYAVLWLIHSEWDHELVYNQYGYVTEIYSKNNQNYKNFVNAYYDCLTQGTTQQSFNNLLAAICDIPCTQKQEKIVQIAEDLNHLWIITEQKAYPYHKDSTPRYSVDTLIPAGTFLTNAISLYEFTNGQVPAEEDVDCITLNSGLLGRGFRGGLTFLNQELPTTVTENVNGYTELRFPIQGFADDVEKFWQQVHHRGIQQQKTLAMCLDTREVQNTQPIATFLPETINPFAFLCQNFFRNNVVLVVVYPDLFGKEALGTTYFNVFRNLLPPHTTVLFIIKYFFVDETWVFQDTDTSEFFDLLEMEDDFLPGVIEDTIQINNKKVYCV